MFYIRPIEDDVRQKVLDIWVNNWGSDLMVTKGKAYKALDYPGYIAVENNEVIGLIIYRIEDKECEILSLDSLSENRGVGSKLLEKVVKVSTDCGCDRIWLITSNDNTKAMRFYQKRGFEFKAIHLNAIDDARNIKPQIPLVGYDNIPIRHEIEMEFKL